MIYFDNSATTLIKPESVGKSVEYAINNFGNPSRSFNKNALLAAREIYNTREEIAKLVRLDDPLKVAFTSSATESLNLVINGLIECDDHVITTVFDHNAILRPLYNVGCDISVLSFNDEGRLDYNNLSKLIKDNTKAIVCTHASNVTGDVIDTKLIKEFCQKYNLIFILDASQSLGSIEVRADMADIICFTGHKSLFGPQGTGGIISKEELHLKKIIKTGGAGGNSFEKTHSALMPDIFEVGTLNSHSIYGLQQGVKFVNEITIPRIKKHKESLINYFYKELKKIEGIKIYGNFDDQHRVPVISINYKNAYSYDFSQKLYEKYDIATRAQSHCAPLIHEFYKTKDQGMVRFSLSYFNTLEEIKICIESIKKIIGEYK